MPQPGIVQLPWVWRAQHALYAAGGKIRDGLPGDVRRQCRGAGLQPVDQGGRGDDGQVRG